jgi:hypothetical protein
MENEDNVNPPPQQHPHLKIPAFWTSNPEAWFAIVEGQFVLKGVTQDTMKFYHVLGSLPETTVLGLGDLMRGPPQEDAYIQLKVWLLAAHTLTEFQRMEKLLAAQALGSQKPSDMLHDLVQFCLDGEAQTRIFRYLYLQQLPTEIRIILAEDRDSKLATLAARADQLWAHSTRQPHDAAVNAVLEKEGHETIAVVSSSHHSSGGGRGWGRGSQSRPFRGRGGGGAPPVAPADSNPNTPSKMARQSSGLCRFHWQFVKKPTAAGLPAPGRETRVPGPPQSHRPRVLGSHRGPIVRKTFFN